MGNNAQTSETEERVATSHGDTGMDSESPTERSNSQEGEQSLTDLVGDMLKKHGVTDSDKGQDADSPADEGEDSSDVQKLNKTGQEQEKLGEEENSTEEADATEEEAESASEQEEQQTEQEEQTEQEQPEKGPVPYERFHEVNEAAKAATVELEQLRPLAKAQQDLLRMCNDTGITPEVFSQMMTIGGLVNSNPEEALKQLTPIYQGLLSLVGEALPADLQTKVDQGKMELDDAKEMARMRAQQKLGAERGKQTAAQAERQRQQQHTSSVLKAVDAWETAKRKSDPDYKPKADAKAKDGLWEQVMGYVKKLDRSVLFKSPESAVAECEAAYALYKGMARTRAIAKPVRKNLSGNGASARVTGQPKSILDAAKVVLQERGATMRE